MSIEIPIRNIYYLLCYAWNYLPQQGVIHVDAIDGTQLVDLFAHILTGGVDHLLRRGIDRGYMELAEETPRPRGRIDMERSLLLLHSELPKLHCRFDELDHDVLHNQILRTTIGRLIRVVDLNDDLRRRLQKQHRQLARIREIPLTAQTFRRVQLHSSVAFYRFLLHVCELVYHSLLADETSGNYHFREFTRDEGRMAEVFERFVRHFYEREQQEYKVSASKIAWDATPLNEESRAMLPEMQTDMVLRSSKRTLVIDTKYYREALQVRHNTRKAHSENLYQIYSYIRNLECGPGPDACADGMLLYPTVSYCLDLRYMVREHLVQVRTIDLQKEWRDIRCDLLKLLE